jgi:tetratricopeptide (TPR) repeat protein
MNKSLNGFLLLLCCISFSVSVFLPSCTNSGRESADETDSVLARPPYATLTDSIRQAAATPATEAALYFRRGELLAQNNLHEIAVSDYKRSWELLPDQTTALRYASTLSITGHTEEAVNLLKDSHQKFPANDSFSRLLGELYMQSGRMKEALALYDTTLRKDSLNFDAWYEKALLLERTRDTAGAIASLKKAYALQPTNTYALELAHLYAEKGNGMALSLCDEVMAKDSTKELLDPLFIKGIYYANTGQHAKAIGQFDSCIRRDWKFTDAYLEKGILLFKQKNYAQALKTFNMTVTVSNTYPDGYFWIGRCYEVAGRREEAILYYQQALALDKDFTEAADHIKNLK